MNPYRLRAVISALPLITLLFACSAQPPTEIAESKIPRETVRVPAEQLQSLTAGQRAFALDLYAKLRTTPGNLLFSPHSISTALAMTYAGAHGDTATQIAHTLHFDLPPDQLHAALNGLQQKIDELALLGTGTRKRDSSEPAAGFQLSVANRLWSQTGYPLRPEFLDTLARHYGAGVALVDFAAQPRPAADTINTWVAEQTRGRIHDIISADDLNSLTRLIIVNAVYFRARWQSEFDPKTTQLRPFTLLDGRKIDVPTMAQSKHFLYAAGDGYEAIELPYDPDCARMLILVPAPGTLDAFEQSLTPAKLDAIITSMSHREVALQIPKFEFASSYVLNSALIALGMSHAFDNQAADFTGISDAKPGVYISTVAHKAFIKVDERETEAAAVTAVGIEAKVARPDPAVLHIDRPFIFAIRETRTGAILFLGRVTNPQSQSP